MRITEIKRIEVQQCIPQNPFHLKWLNIHGGMDNWVFQKHQEYSYDIDGGDEFVPIIIYLNEVNGYQRTVQKTVFQIVKIGYEGLTAQQAGGIINILASPLVYLITGQPQTNSFKTTIVAVKPGSYNVGDVYDSKFKLEFEIIKPKRFIQSS
jgi:hypothetical protein